jgi:NADPH2:quinone reductase
MRAVLVTEFGGPDVLRVAELPTPEPGPGELLVRLEAADTLNVETTIRSGLARDWFDTRPPYVPGGGGAGTVVAAGDGADPAWVGRRVVAATGRPGGYAELATAAGGDVVAVPDGVAATDAAALLHDAVTALALLAAFPVATGDRVLVTAAGGGMGLLLVQLALAAGADVVGAAGDPRKLGVVRDLGAAAVDYGRPDWTREVLDATGGKGADVVLDGAGGAVGLAAFEVTAPGGRISAHGAAAGGFAPVDRGRAAGRGITVRGIEELRRTGDRTALLASALARVAAGTLRPVVGRTFPLERASDAHRAIEARDVVGKALLLP